MYHLHFQIFVNSNKLKHNIFQIQNSNVITPRSSRPIIDLMDNHDIFEYVTKTYGRSRLMDYPIPKAGFE